MHTMMDTMFQTHAWGVDKPHEAPARHHLSRRAIDCVGEPPRSPRSWSVSSRFLRSTKGPSSASTTSWSRARSQRPKPGAQQWGRELGVELQRKTGQPVVAEPAVLVASSEPAASPAKAKK